jgi:hypothetical protein
MGKTKNIIGSEEMAYGGRRGVYLPLFGNEIEVISGSRVRISVRSIKAE